MASNLVADGLAVSVAESEQPSAKSVPGRESPDMDQPSALD